MRYCSKCNIMLAGDGIFCIWCGEETVSPTMKCPYCENEIGVANKFCDFCGKPIQEEIQEFIKNERKVRSGKRKGGDKR